MQNRFTKNSILIFLAANNFSEEEYLIVKQVFLKANKKIFITSDSNSVCSGDNGMKVKADTEFLNINEMNFTAIVLIGGKGSKDYWDNETLWRIVKNFNASGKIVAAICSAPIILARAGLLSKVSATCWTEDKIELIKLGIKYNDRSVIAEKGVITSDGPRSAEQFAETVLNMIK
ncbi:MAG: DJ-1/PfpI family protein [Bacteroidetes bacterium]|nr:DJ-1/PfpI family protein [Bacteroidota bacterium]MCH7771678.1 DJ-1/PfpI family protein [Bacteroidota bacterium]